ncbi:multidrug effflux MFS transporter [Brachybacterium sacelli]
MPPRRLFVAVLVLLTAVAPLSIDMYLPAFPTLAEELGSTATGVQLSMTAFLVGMALGQLFVGPLSDGIGRRAPLLAGTFVCFVASVVCAIAPSIEILIGARFLQGLGGAAGVVLARAIVSDTARGALAAKLLGALMIVSVIAPVAAPLAGGALIAGIGWRGVFWVVAGLVLLMFLAAAVVATESLPTRERTSGGVPATFRAAREVLSNRTYTGYLLTFCLSFAALFAYISASPFVIQNILGFSTTTFSLLFAVNAVAITVTSAVAAALAGKIAYRRMTGWGLSAGAVAAVGLLVCALSGVPMLPTLVLFALFQGSLGFVFANATALALQETGRNAGTGSAFLGFLQFMLAALVSPLVGLAGEATAVPMGIVMVIAMGLAVASFLVLPRRDGRTSQGDDEEHASHREGAAVA